jgi:O-antigen ligase
MPLSHHGAAQGSPPALWWETAVCGWLILMIVSGGISLPSALVTTVHSVSSIFIIAVAAWHLRRGFPTWVAAAGAVLILLGLLLIVAQLVPLPPDVWSVLPKRNLVVDIYTASGRPLPWLPLNLQPSAGYGAAMAFLPAIAGYLAVLTLDSRRLTWIALIILSCALFSAVLALAQRYAGFGYDLHFYGKESNAVASGTFNNRNFLAAQLFAAIPFVAATAMHVTDHWRVPPWLSTLFAATYTGMLLTSLAASGSRGGVLLAMLGVFLTFALVFRWHRFAQSGAAIFATLAAIFVISQASMVGILRLAERDPLADFRTTIYTVASKGAYALFPMGGGFGSFASVYQIFENPADIVDNYVNHAHNDWLELVFDGGLPALLLLMAFLFLTVVAAVRLVRLGMFSHGSAFYRAAAVSAFLLMVHALVDFGLRTPALMSLFAVLMGMVTLPGAVLRGREQQHRPAADPGLPKAPRSLRPFVPGTFGVRRKPSTEQGS